MRSAPKSSHGGAAAKPERSAYSESIEPHTATGGGGLMAPAEFRVGQAVRILDGPFTNFIGIVRAVATTPAGLITVGVGLQGREVPVEIDRYRLEQIR